MTGLDYTPKTIVDQADKIAGDGDFALFLP